MKIIRGTTLLFLAILFFSCSNKKMDTNEDELSSGKNSDAETAHNYYEEFVRRNASKVQMIHPLKYYKNIIEVFQEDFYNMKSISIEINDIMNISSITQVENVVPDLLTFLVCWINPKGSVYYLYCFDEHCGQTIFLIPERQILMEKLSGNIIENEVVSVGDFNNDGINEIALYTQYQNIGNAFCVHGFNLAENKMEELCVASRLCLLIYGKCFHR